MIGILMALDVVLCSQEEDMICPPGSRCVTHNTTGDSFCLQSCYLQNGGCPADQVCYYKRREEEEDCNQLLEPCFKTACTDVSGMLNWGLLSTCIFM